MVKDGVLTLELEINHENAMALAQFVKRAGWSDFKANAASEDEAYRIKDGMAALYYALAQQGYAPR